MSYIGLLNETDMTTDTATIDTISIITNLSSLGTNTLNNTTLTGSVIGFNTIGEGETIFSYTPSTRTFNISTPVNSIDPSKLIAGNAGQIIQTNDLNDAVWVDMSGDAIINSNGVMTVDKSRTVLMYSILSSRLCNCRKVPSSTSSANVILTILPRTLSDFTIPLAR